VSIMRTCVTCGAVSDKSRCPKHRKDDRPSASKRGYDARWRATRGRYLGAHRTCEDETGCIADATEVHHLDGLGPKGLNGHEWHNLMALCKHHHSRITARDQSGWGKR
jgi:5-methylcytosine-specific restriction enzyme A